jgi:hypothetical protein
MKNGLAISSGNQVKKRQNNDDFIRNFHKKLKIEDDIDEVKPITVKHTSTALILHKNPIAPLSTIIIPKE